MPEITHDVLLHRTVGAQAARDERMTPANAASIAERFVDSVGDVVMNEDRGPFWLVEADGRPAGDYSDRDEADDGCADDNNAGVAVIDLTEYRAEKLESVKATFKPITVQALVTLQIVPGPARSEAESSELMQRLLAEYLTSPDYHFREDYGVTPDDYVAFRAGVKPIDDITIHGYDGPFVVDAAVQVISAVEPATGRV